MSGYLKIRNDYSDAQAVILTLESREKDSGTRKGASMKIDIGKESVTKLPDFLLEVGEVSTTTDSEPVDQQLERMAARIQTLEAEKEAALVAGDETDHHRMQELMKALHNERETTRALGHALKLVEREFENNVTNASEDQLGEIERRHKLSSDREKNDRVNALKTTFDNSSVADKVELMFSSRTALDEEQTREAAASHHTDQQHGMEDKDARHVGDTYRGADSTTDLNDTASTRDEGEDSVEYSDEDVAEDNSGANNTTASTGDGASAGAQPTDHRSEDPHSSHVETQEKADEMIGSDEEEDEEATEISEKAEEISEKAEEIKEQSNNPQKDEQKGTFPFDTGGGTNDHEDVEDRPVIMEEKDSDEGTSEVEATDQENKDEFRSQVNKLRVAQLKEVEEQHDLSGEGNRKERQESLKEYYDETSEDNKKALSRSVEKVSGE